MLVCLVSLTKIRTKFGHEQNLVKIQRPDTGSIAMANLYLFSQVKQDQERFLQFFPNQTIPW